MGGQIQWGSLDWIAEKYGIDDFEIWLHALVTIRDNGSSNTND